MIAPRLHRSVLALAGCGFVACGGDDTPASESDETSESTESTAETASDTGDDTTDDGTTSAEDETDGDEATDDTGDETETTGEVPGYLVLEEILHLDAVVATKGMDVAPNGDVLVWNYNQDQLERFDGRMLSVIVPNGMGLVTSFGTDLTVDGDGYAYVSKGGDSTGDTLQKWDATTGEAQWGPDGVTVPDGLLLGLTDATVGGSPRVFVADGGASGGQILQLQPSDGVVEGSTPVDDTPIDVAVDPEGNLFVLTSAVSNPVNTGDPVFLRKYDPQGIALATAVELKDAVYLALASDGQIHVSVTDFTVPRRKILSYDADLTLLGETELPEAYEGFAGGITTRGEGEELRVMITGQEGVGSGPICDVLVYAAG